MSDLVRNHIVGFLVSRLKFFSMFDSATWCPDANETELERKKVQIIEEKYKTQRKQIDVLKRHIDELKGELRWKKEQIPQETCDVEKKQIGILNKKINQLNEELEVNKNQERKTENTNHHLPYIYVVTPTNIRLEQKADLTRLSYTLRHVPNLHWIVIEDSETETPLVKKLLTNCKLPYTHLVASTPEVHKLKVTDPNWLKPRGVPQRNAGIKWLRDNAKKAGVVYFADDDNTYDLQIFEEVSVTCLTQTSDL